MTTTIAIGAKVMWRGSWGGEPPKETTITGIELCEKAHQKYGLVVDEVFAVDKDRCVFDLENGHWAYGDQIDLIEKDELVLGKEQQSRGFREFYRGLGIVTEHAPSTNCVLWKVVIPDNDRIVAGEDGDLAEDTEDLAITAAKAWIDEWLID